MLPAYTRAAVTLHTSRADQLAVLNTLAQAGNRNYTYQLLRVDDAGSELEDLTPYVVRGRQPATVAHDCTAECPGKLTTALSQPLQWGYDRVQPISLISAPGYAGGAWQGFPRGIFVATTPGSDNLDVSGRFDVAGWDRVYLLQSDPQNSWSFASGSTYLAAVTALIHATPLLNGSDPLSVICTYPGDWSTKTLPQTRTWPAGSGSTRIQIINSLLTESGMRPLHTDPTTGGWRITAQTPADVAALAWRWQGSDVTNPPTALGDTGWPDRKIVRYARQAYSGDVYNAPNRWIFIQSGLTFQPTHTDGSDGRYVVDNTTRPPGDQISVGRTIAKVVTVDASGQADLVTQGDRIVDDDLASIEQVTLVTVPWPTAAHFDVFQFSHQNFPDSPIRRLEAQSWEMDLEGPGEMTWSTKVAGLL